MQHVIHIYTYIPADKWRNSNVIIKPKPNVVLHNNVVFTRDGARNHIIK